MRAAFRRLCLWTDLQDDGIVSSGPGIDCCLVEGRPALPMRGGQGRRQSGPIRAQSLPAWGRPSGRRQHRLVRDHALPALLRAGCGSAGRCAVLVRYAGFQANLRREKLDERLLGTATAIVEDTEARAPGRMVDTTELRLALAVLTRYVRDPAPVRLIWKTGSDAEPGLGRRSGRAAWNHPRPAGSLRGQSSSRRRHAIALLMR